jgi:hypothetical protein
MAKTKHPSETPPGDKPSGDHEKLIKDSNQPAPMIFLNWIDPPIGVNMSGVDNVNQFYKVSIMSVGVSGGGQSLILPFAEPFQWNPMAAPTIRCQYQLTSILPGDPSGLDFYETMTLSQSSGGQQTIRSRIFIPPQTQAFASVPTAVASAAVPSYIRVSGVTNSANLQVTVVYLHFLTNDQYGPTDLFLQQPW